MAEESSQEEEDYNSFLHFVDALEMLSHDAETTCEEMGNYNTPWEIQHDLDGGSYLATSPIIAMTDAQRIETVRLMSLLEHLPQDAIAVEGMEMTTHAGCVNAMRHPAWTLPRELAAHLLKILGPAIKRTQDYFYPAEDT